MKTEQLEFMCNCGHIEHQDNIHSIETFEGGKSLDLCDKCFDEADLTQQPEGKLSSYRFTTLEAQKEANK